MAAPSQRGSQQSFGLAAAPELDDDGRAARTGNLWTCVAHIITGVIGAGVLALSWSVAQLGWVAGPLSMLCFAAVTYVSAVLLSHCYRSPVVAGRGEEEQSSGKTRRNYTYMEAVRALLGRKHVYVCGTLQYLYLYGIGVAYTLTTATCLGDQEVQLLPRPRARRRPLRLRRGRAAPVHAALRRGAAGAVLHPQLPQHGVALRGGGGHVLHLRHHRPEPGPRQDRGRRRDQGRRGRRADGHVRAEGLAGGAGGGRHRVRVPVHHRAPGDPGHAAVVAARGRDHAEGERGRRPRHHLLLPLRRLLRVRRLRQRGPGEPPHRLRLLRAVLARRLRQRLHHPPHPRRLPDVQPADIHGGGQVVGGEVPGERVREQDLRRADRAGAAEVRAEPAAALLPDGVRGQHDGAGRGVPLLQRGAGPTRRAHILAARHLPPRGDVLRAAAGQAVDGDVGRAAGVQRRVLRRRDLRVRRLRRGRYQEETRIGLARLGCWNRRFRPLYYIVQLAIQKQCDKQHAHHHTVHV